MKLSALVFSSNSEKTLKSTLASVSFADEQVVVDATSSDKSQEIARSHGADVHLKENPGYVEPLRQFGVDQTSHEWVLMLDGDEEITGELQKEIPTLLTRPVDAWWIPRKNLILGEWMQHAGWWPDFQLRLFKKDAVSFSDKIHAKPEISGVEDRLEASESLAIVHHNYDSVSQYIDRLNQFTNLESASVKLPSAKKSLRVFFDDFFSRYYALGGYKSNDLGLYVSLLQAFYQFTAVLKASEQNTNLTSESDVSGEIDDILSDFAYWRANQKVHQHPKLFSKLYWKLRRTLRI